MAVSGFPQWVTIAGVPAIVQDQPSLNAALAMGATVPTTAPTFTASPAQYYTSINPTQPDPSAVVLSGADINEPT